jgi:hypothetical protein
MPTVTISEPSNGETISSVNDTEWSYDGTDTGEGLKYIRHYIDGEIHAELGPYVGGITTRTGQLSGWATLDPWGTYSWQVKVMSHDTDPDYSYESSVVTFTKDGTFFPPIKAENPTPADSATGIVLALGTLDWDDGGGADTFDVYFGTESGNLSLVSSEQAATQYTLGSVLAYGTTYYWRVDATNEYGTTTGDEWSFTTLSFDPPGSTARYKSDDSVVPIGTAFDSDTMYYTGENFIANMATLIAAADDAIWYEDPG